MQRTIIDLNEKSSTQELKAIGEHAYDVIIDLHRTLNRLEF
jgi:hypothetical protein